MFQVVDHPLIRHHIRILRDKDTPPYSFREAVKKITSFLAYEALRDLHTKKESVQTPLMETIGERISDSITLVPILRAGLGMLEEMQRILPCAKVGVLGMQRNEKTAEPIPYYSKLPKQGNNELAILIDPMLATGGSACDALDHLKKSGYNRILFLSIISAPEGVARVEKMHPDVPIFTAALDERLNEDFYILPGLGDAGDRIFGTV